MNQVKVSIFALAVAAVAAFSFRSMEGGSITGKVKPLDGASVALAIQGEDTLKTDMIDGTFNVQGAKAGTYTVVIDAKQPFMDVTIKDVKVEDGKVTELGEIKLEQ
jgi:hypothetical protein